jgi:GTPase SAR1 family protein
MKKSSPELVLASQSILLMGPPGGGKTTFALQWPNLWVANCDQNLAGPMRYLANENKYPAFSYDDIAQDGGGTPVPMHLQWNRLESVTKDALADPSISTLFIDSLTHVDRILYAHCCKAQGVKDLEFQQWNMFKNSLYRYIMEARTSGKTILLACHENIEYDKKGAVEKYVPTVSTNLKNYFGYMFTDIWRCTLETVGGGKITARITTHPNNVSDLKNSLLLGKSIDASYAAVEAAVNKFKLKG